MSKTRDYVFVLWGDQFDEASAAIFVTELRTAGLRVKVLSLTKHRASGRSGLMLMSDLTLEQALPLANKASCVIIPCKPATLKRLMTDPRLQEFFKLSQLNNALFITSENVSGSHLFPSGDKVLVYPELEILVPFVREIAKQLQ